MVLQNCIRCGKSFTTQKSFIKNGEGRFCSRKCAGKYRFETGISSLRYFISNKKENTNLIEEDKKCNICGSIEMMRNNTLKQIEEGRLYRSNTLIERKIEDLLKFKKIDFKHQYKLGYWCFDFFIPPNILIEADGDYWHGNPEKFKELNNTQLRNLQNDKRKTEYASRMNYNLVRFWEKDIKNRWSMVEGTDINSGE